MLKKSLLVLMLTAMVGSITAQSLRFEYNGTTFADGQTIICPFDDLSGEYLQRMEIRNLTDNEIGVVVAREILKTVDGALSYFCWGMCYSPEVDTSSRPVPVYAQSLSDSELSFHCMFTEEDEEVVSVRYFAYDANNPEDQVSIIILSGKGSGIVEHSIEVGHAYPNPATTRVSFSLKSNDNANIDVVVYNLLGQEVKSQVCTASHRHIDIAVDDMQPGIYFCSFRTESGIAQTEKFIVKR